VTRQLWGAAIRTKVAIACQGGGSQTAFTAGVLKALSDAHLQDEFEFVSISGTSGGALCATLVWYALRKGEQPIWRRLMAFWRDNTAQSHPELLINNMVIEWMRMVNRGMLPVFQTSPSSPLVQAVSQFFAAGHRREFSDFQALLRRHIDFDELLAWGAQPTAPVLIIGAASVLSGQLRKFNSTQRADPHRAHPRLCRSAEFIPGRTVGWRRAVGWSLLRQPAARRPRAQAYRRRREHPAGDLDHQN
jgi:NTE family protein